MDTGTNKRTRTPDAFRSFTLMSAVQPQDTRFLGVGIAFGELSLLDGDPGTNKSSVLLDFAARVSTGRPMPDGTRTEAGGVLLLMAEDSVAKTIRPRLEAAGAALTRIAILNQPVSIPKDRLIIEEAALKLNAKLVIIDPIMAF